MIQRDFAIQAALRLGLTAAVATVGGTSCTPRESSDVDARPVVLRVANWGSPANVSEFLALDRAIQRDFEARYPDRRVRVAVEQIPGENQYTAKLMMMHLAGNMPDVVHLDASSAAVFIDNDVLVDLSGRLASDPDIHANQYFTNVLDIARRGERLYAIPLDFTPMVIVYNKRLFDQAGVAYPRDGWTWEEFLETCAALKARPPADTAVWYPFDFWNWMPGWYPFIIAGGGDVLDESGRRATGAFDSEATRRVLRGIVHDLVGRGLAPHPRQRTAVGKDLFRSQMAAMILTGHWMMLEYNSEGLDVGIVSVPTTGRRITVMYATGLAISRQARHPDLAWEFIEYMTSDPVQRIRNQTGLAISGNRSAAAALATNEVERAFLGQVRYARAPWGSRVERYQLVEDLGWEMMEDVLHAGRDVDEAAAAYARLMDRELSD